MGDRPAPVPGVDPLFTDEDVEELLDYLAWKNSLCPGGCGQPRHESFDPANEWSYKVEVFHCHACGAMRRAENRLVDRGGMFSVAEKKGLARTA